MASLLKKAHPESKPILLGLFFGAVLSATVPLIKTALRACRNWTTDPQHVDGEAFYVLVPVIVALAVLAWPGPMLLRAFKSYATGVNRGSFFIPALATFCMLELRYWLPMSWWIVAIAVIGATSCLLIYLPFGRSGVNVPRDDRSDDARRSLPEAWPERKALAHEISRHVLREGRETYAVYGGFGSGKSSMLNFIGDILQEEADDRAIVVRFNGWLPGSRENLADQLLSDIATECSRRYYTPYFRRTALRVARSINASVPHLEWLAEWLPQETQQDAIDDLREVLERLPSRIVVLVDEIDRMRKEELFVLLKLIRGFTSLPRISFVCALERTHVERMISKEFGAVDHTFYHKFFVESFELPKLTDSFLEAEAHDQLMKVFEEQEWFKSEPQAKIDYSNALQDHWQDIFAPICTNIREVGRIAASVRAQSWSLVDEVSPLDLTLLSALRYFAPTYSDLIWSFRNTLCAPDIDGSTPNPDVVYEAEIASFIEAESHLGLNQILLEQARRIRRVLFSGLDEICDSLGKDANKKVNATVRYFERNKSGARKKELRNASYFPAYFQNIVPATIFPERDIADLLTLLERADEYRTQQIVFDELNELDGTGDKRLNFIEKLADKAVHSLDLARCSLVANVVVGRSTGLDDPDCEREYSLIARFVMTICDALFSAGRAEDRLRLIRNCILGARADGVAFRIFQWAVSRPFPEVAIASQRGIDNVPWEQLEGAYLERMEARYGLPVDPTQVELNLSYWLAFNDWGVILKKTNSPDLQREFWKRYICSSDRLADFARYVLSPFAQQAHSGANISFLWGNILSKDDLRSFAKAFPPYQDLLAASYLKEILGDDVIVEPTRTPQRRHS